MPKLPGVNHLDAVRALEKAGFWIARQGKHIIASCCEAKERVMKILAILGAILLASLVPVHAWISGDAGPKSPAPRWPADLPVYDHVVILVEENKDYEEIIGNPSAPYINKVLRTEGANFTRMFGEEHFSQGN